MGDYLTLSHIAGGLSVTKKWMGIMILVNRWGATNSYNVVIEVKDTDEGEKTTIYIVERELTLDFDDYVSSNHKDGWTFHFLDPNE
ncbi:hypothetical protein P4493_04300 [Bacillus thuringiensis]|uniref:Uncharacterized protein n=3 Tax=Bacillus thuringiensis TaxID=1428 RepID=A0A0B5NL95_BACTU|nr:MULTISPECIES: hypothetical protein [Bacillus]MEC2535498.1 hypothetical protein [Bacillus cereus]MED1153788.1 hypothetical protein [Bacillus paranthracis]OUB09350.1 hypothetical protein BK708_33035 [Bacillus thuringiensis serovar yunnanensis]AFQ30100.1 hypothetical protein BTF1_29997 [Bacillus thuringiensis HD-789]AJG74132.1 hypothetical protein BF38_5902 [Bacillus thuringiensis]